MHPSFNQFYLQRQKTLFVAMGDPGSSLLGVLSARRRSALVNVGSLFEHRSARSENPVTQVCDQP